MAVFPPGGPTPPSGVGSQPTVPEQKAAALATAAAGPTPSLRGQATGHRSSRWGSIRGGVPIGTVPCPWCRQPLWRACCPSCLNRAASKQGNSAFASSQAAIEASQQAVAASLEKWSQRLALRERRMLLTERIANLRERLSERRGERGAGSARARRRQLEERRREFLERRRRHEQRAAEWAAAKRRYEPKRSHVSRAEFFRDPAAYGAALGAFHVYQELAVVSNALQRIRRQRCSQLLAILPLKWIVTGVGSQGGGDQTVTLGQVQSFSAVGVLQAEEVKDLEAALSFLIPLVSLLATYLDVTLPYPCCSGHGHAAAVQRSGSSEVTASSEPPPTGHVSSASVGALDFGGPYGKACDAAPLVGTTQASAVPEAGAKLKQSEPSEGLGAVQAASLGQRGSGCVSGGSTQPSSASSTGAHRAAWWTSPCVLNPVTERWHYFSIYDHICTTEFQTAIKLVDEDLRQLCLCQGVPLSPPLYSSQQQLQLQPTARLGTLQLLAQLLSSPHLGCTSPPLPIAPPLERSAAASLSVGSGSCSAGQMSQQARESLTLSMGCGPLGASSSAPMEGNISVGGGVGVSSTRYGDELGGNEDDGWTLVEHEL